MVDIDRFKAELTEAKNQKDAERTDGLAHSKTVLAPILELARAANSVFVGKITIRDPRPDGFAYSTEIDVDGSRIEFVTSPGQKNFTINGLDDELAKLAPPEKPIGIHQSLRQITGGRTMEIDQLEVVAAAFAAFLKWRLVIANSR